MKINNFVGKVTFSTESEKFVGNRGKCETGEMHHCLRGEGRPCWKLECRLFFVSFRLNTSNLYMFVFEIQWHYFEYIYNNCFYNLMLLLIGTDILVQWKLPIQMGP